MSMFQSKDQSYQKQVQSMRDYLDAYQQKLMKPPGSQVGQPIGGFSNLQQWQNALGLSAINARVEHEMAPVRNLPEEIVVSALIGWRRWSVDMFGETLKSNNSTPWKPYEKLTADCKSSGCLGIRCGCGIYAYKERSLAEKGENAPSTVTHVWGEVWLWGRVVEHENGFRAQFGYPKAFVNTGGISQRLAHVYGVKIL